MSRVTKKKQVTFKQWVDILTRRVNEIKQQKKQGNHKIQDSNIFRIRAYNNVIQEIQSSHYLSEIITELKVNRLDITTTMADKTKKFMKGASYESLFGKLSKISSKKSLEYDLKKIKGIGDTTKLIQAGVKSISDLKKLKYKHLLSDTSLSYIKHNPLTKIKCSDIKKIEALTSSIKIKHIYVGSYRRKKCLCRDVDILVVGPQNILLKFKDALERKNITLWVYTSGKDRISTIAKIPGITRKIKFDFFRSPKGELAPQLLYSTGSADFNQMIRGMAKRKEMLLNQHGLYNRLKTLKILTPTEKSIFKKIGLVYKEPEDRI